MKIKLLAGLVLFGMVAGAAWAQDTAPVAKPSPGKGATVRDEHNKPIEGTCKVSLTVDTQGRPKHVHTEMCTDKRLMPYAKDHVEHESFTPAEHEGKPVSASMTANVFFRAEPLSPIVRRLNMKRDLPEASSEVDVPVDIVEGITPPELIYSAPATFPESVRKSKKECKTQVELVVDRDGLPRDTKVLRSCGTEADHNALQALSQYLFKPARNKEGKAVPVHVTVEVGFTLYRDKKK